MEAKYTLENAFCAISAQDADKLIAEGDAGCALLYLYLLRRGGSGGEQEAAAALRMPADELRRCAARLRALGLMRGEKLPPSDDERPEYSAEYIVRRSREDSSFRGVLAETESTLGHTLSSADMKTLFGIYDSLGLPPEVILLLLHYCVETYRERNGEGRVPPMRSIEKEAYAWANREILSLEAAEEHIALCRKRQDVHRRLRQSFGLRERDFTPTERKHIDGWLDAGFGAEALELAYDRTVTNTGSLKWPYFNKIMQSWQQKGLHSAEEIERGDKPKPSSKEPLTDGEELERMRKIYDRINKG